MIISEDHGLEEDFQEKELKLLTFCDGIPNAVAVKNDPALRRSASFVHVTDRPSRRLETSRGVALCLRAALQVASSSSNVWPTQQRQRLLKAVPVCPKFSNFQTQRGPFVHKGWSKIEFSV